METTEEIKGKIDIVEYISQYTPLTKSGKTYRGLCPFHSEKHGSFFVYPEQQRWHCFGACGIGGDIFSFVSKKDGISFGESLKLLAQKCGVQISGYEETGNKRAIHDRLFQANQIAAEYYHRLLLDAPEAQNVRAYLTKRGLTATSLEEFKLGYSPNAWDHLLQYLLERGFSKEEIITAGLAIESESKTAHDRFRHRLMFPIINSTLQIIGFGGRTLDDTIPKYLNSPQTPIFDKSSVLYGLHAAKNAIAKKSQAVIVEGYMDVILPHQFGYKNTVATMGTAIGESHVSQLKKITRNIVLAFDSDNAGEQAVFRSLWIENSVDSELGIVSLPNGLDPDEIVRDKPEYWETLVSKAMPALDFVFEKSINGLDLKTVLGKTTAAEKLIPYINSIQNPIRKGFYLNKLAKLVGQDAKKLEVLLTYKPSIKTSSNNSINKKQTVLSSSHEEYCLALLLQNNSLLAHCSELLPDFFNNSENREIYHAILNTRKNSHIKDLLDPVLWEYHDRLTQRTIIGGKLEYKLAETILRMKEEYLKRLAQNRGDSLAMDESTQLRAVFAQKKQLDMQKRRQK